jgi:RNA-directed DNA polymerase
VSSASEAATPSNRNAAREVGVAHTSEEAGQRPRSKGAAQGKLLDEGTTAAPEAELTVSPKLAELVARARKEDRLTNVVQFVDEELLHLAFRSLRKRAAPGVDGQSYEDYAANLDTNLKDVYKRLRTGRYRAPVVRRAYIPKANGGRRPLGITTIEDRVVQKAVAWVLSAVFEQDFLECSHGFRPGRSAHTALHRLREGMMQHWAKYVVEVDVVGYFDHVGHGWLLKFLRHRVNDGGLLRLVSKWLKAGVMEAGVVVRTEEGTPQGGPVSPILANVYLHFVLDLWFERRFKETCRKWTELTRYCDDFVAAFQDRGDAERFRQEVEERLAAFGLRVAPEKTAVRRFDGNLIKGPGRPAVKPESFTFLGFTHFLAKTREKKVHIRLTPSVKSRERFLRRAAEWLRLNRHAHVRIQQAHLSKMLSGHYQYFGLRLCGRRLSGVRHRVFWLWRQALRRRSEMARRTCDWATLNAKPWFQLPRPRLTQMWV